MNHNVFVVYDFETTSPNPARTQIVQIACVAVDPRSLEIIPGSEFNTLVRPYGRVVCKFKGLDPLSKAAEAIHGLGWDILRDAPSQAVAWRAFADHVHQYTRPSSKGKPGVWHLPVGVGYNSAGFDARIADRYSAMFGTGPLFRPGQVDLMQEVFLQTENLPEFCRLNLESACKKAAIAFNGSAAHDAMYDVMKTAELLKAVIEQRREEK